VFESWEAQASNTGGTAGVESRPGDIHLSISRLANEYLRDFYLRKFINLIYTDSIKFELSVIRLKEAELIKF